MTEIKIPFPGNSPATKIFLAKYENDPNVTVVYVYMQAERTLKPEIQEIEPEPIQEIEPEPTKETKPRNGNGKK